MALTGRHDYENMLCWLPEIDTNKYGIPEIRGIKELPEDAYFTNSEFLISLISILSIFHSIYYLYYILSIKICT